VALSSISGGENLKKFLGKIKNQTGQIDVGFFPEAVYDDGTQVAQVAFDNCFGHINTGADAEKYGRVVPARNFMQKAFDDNNKKWREDLLKIIIEQKENIDIEKALKAEAFIIKKDIQNTIDWFATSGQPRNGPKMQAIKGVDSPLIWKGKMQNSVETVVKK
jgi:hypothetical protein